MDAVNCPLCPLFWLCKAMSPETDIDRANKQNAALRAENHAEAGLEQTNMGWRDGKERKRIGV